MTTNPQISPQPQPTVPDDVPAWQMRLLLICHAEEMHNRYSDLIDADSGLTARGWQQTDSLAAWLLTHEGVDILISAPQLRNRLTAQRIGQTIGLPVTVRAGLDGQKDLELARMGVGLPHLFSDQLAGDVGFEHLYEELQRLLSSLPQNTGSPTIAVVMDASAISALISMLLGSDRLCFAIDVTGISELVRRGDEWYIGYVNRREHSPTSPQQDMRTSETTFTQTDVNEKIAPVAKLYDDRVAAGIELVDQNRRFRLQDLLDFAQLPLEMSVLDVGTGTGLLPLILAEAGISEVIGIDVSPAMLECAEYLRLSTSADVAARVDYRLAAGQSMPFRNERFDAVICRMVLHHWRHPEQILNELVRVLKPDGLLVVADLLSADDPVKWATQNAIEERRNATHVAARSAQQYRDLVVGAGLVVNAEFVASFMRELEEWMAEMSTDGSNHAVVREMIEAGLETDAAGLNARRQDDTLVFEQRMFYIKAHKLKTHKEDRALP